MKRTLAGLLMAGMVSAASAVSLINTDFTSPYMDGDLAGQQSWAVMPETGVQAFSVDATAGVADTAPFAGGFNTTNGNYVYLSPSNTLGNAVDDEWTGSMDFSLSTANSNGWVVGTQEIYDIGLTHAATGELSTDSPSIHLRHLDAGAVWVTLSKTGRFRTLGVLTDAQLGWDPTNTISPDLVTDNLNLAWTIRKTRTDDTYSAVAVLSNTVTGVASVFDPDFHASFPNLNYVVDTNAYPASNVTFAMGHHPIADGNGTKPLIDVAINSLSVDQASGVAPVLGAPALAASSGNGEVELSWTLSPDATSYDIQRSLVSGGPYSSIGTTNGLGFVDTGVVNNTLYYYIVIASSAGVADSGNSNEVIGEPQSAQTGSIIDTHFKAVEGYVDNADLAGQDRWEAQLNTGLNAFTVTNAAGEGYADNTVATFDTALGNGVYYNTIMSNNVSDEWSGSFSFSLSTAATAGQSVTNINNVYDATGTNVIGQVTNSYDITAMTFTELFHIGLIAPENKDNKIRNVSSSQSVGIGLRLTGSDGTLSFKLNNGNTLVSLNLSEMGWDPDWTVSTNTNGPDFETDEITLDWRMRKSSDGYYRAIADASIISSATGETNTKYGVWGSTLAAAATVYTSDLAIFGMTHLDSADVGKDLSGVAHIISPVLVSLNSMSLVKSDLVPPVKVVPLGLRSDVAAGTVILDWDASAEALGYIVRSYPDISGGTPVVELTNTTALTHTDSGLVNGTTYFYSVAANYGVYGEAETAIIAARPLAKITEVSWGPADFVTLNVNFTGTQTTSNSIVTIIGSGGGVGYLTVAYPGKGPSLYGAIQRDGGNWAGTQIKSDGAVDYLKTRLKDGGVGSVLIYAKAVDFTGGTSLDLSGLAYNFQLALNADGGSDNFGSGGGIHAAILNGSQWYVSATALGNGDSGETLFIENLNDELWSPLTEAGPAEDALMTVVGSTPVTVVGLTDIQAIGYFGDQFISLYVDSFAVSYGETATPLQQWTDGFDIYNDDAVATNDYDGDGISNVHEWGTMGNPSDANDNGHQAKSIGLDATGTNFVYIYPRLENDPRPTYTVLDTDNLVFIPWAAATDVVEGGAGLWNINLPSLGLEAVTNLVPIDADAKFIGLEITE